MDALQTEVAIWPTPIATARGAGRGFSKEQLIRKLGEFAERGNLGRGLAALTEYVGATHYLLARYDLSQDDGLDFVVCSDWPFDVVKRLGKVMSQLHSKTKRNGEVSVRDAAGVCQPAGRYRHQPRHQP